MLIRRALLSTALVLAVAAASVPAVTAPAAAAAVGNCTPGAAWPAARDDLAARVVQLVNEHRASKGLGALSVSTSLTASAVWKARHTANYRYLAHNDPAPPVARTVGQRLAACGYTSGGWGENIAAGYPTPEAVMSGWLSSPGHRANIENASFKAIGVGAAVATNGAVYWAQNFGTSTGGAVPPPPSPPSTSGADLSVRIVTTTSLGVYRLAVTVANAGPQPATGASLRVSLPATLALVSAPGCVGTGALTCSLGAISTGGSATVTVSVRSLGARSHTVSATVSAATADPVAANNTASTVIIAGR